MSNGSNKVDTWLFYAADDSKYYDKLAPLTDPAYCKLHEELRTQISVWAEDYLRAKYAKEGVLRILDIGCGTGIQTINLLASIRDVEIVALDSSSSMLRYLKKKLEGRDYSTSCTVIQADLSEPSWVDVVNALESNSDSSNTFDLIMSVYVLHHFKWLEKAVLYKQIRSLIKPGGAFINGDLYSFSSPWVSELSQKNIEEWISDKFNSQRQFHRKYGVESLQLWDSLRDNWLEHVRLQNHPLPIYNPQTSMSKHSCETAEVNMLIAAGFPLSETTFRQGQSALLWSYC